MLCISMYSIHWGYTHIMGALSRQHGGGQSVCSVSVCIVYIGGTHMSSEHCPGNTAEASLCALYQYV